MRILIVEDKIRTARFLRQGFSEEGFVVDLAASGVDGRHAALTEHYDVIILDVMLPGIDGLHVLRDLRAEGKHTPVIVLSARSELEDRLHGLKLGADDYLTKPFAFSELLARVRSIMRRGSSTEPEKLRVADLELDFLRRRVTRAGRQIDLTAKEFGLLSLLLRHRGEVLSRTRIAEQVWDVNFESETNVVDVAIRRLRAKVDDHFTPRLIHTLRGVGYVLEVRDETA